MHFLLCDTAERRDGRIENENPAVTLDLSAFKSSCIISYFILAVKRKKSSAEQWKRIREEQQLH